MERIQNQDVCENLRRIMISKGFSIKALSEASEINVVSLSNILNGKTLGQTETLVKLSNALGINPSQLFTPAPTLKSVRFRSNSIVTAREKATKKTVICNSAKWLNDYNWLEESLKSTDYSPQKQGTYPSILSIQRKNRSPEELARLIRSEKYWDIKNGPILDIAGQIEKSGIKFWLCDFNSKQLFGLSIGEADGGPAIIVNNNSAITAERQIFTTAHELGHLIMHKSSYSDGGNEIEKTELDGNEEEEANRFAGELLLPKEAIEESLIKTKAATLTSWVLDIKSRYKVSYRTVLKRAVDLGIFSQDVYWQFASQYKRFYNHDLKNNYEPNPNKNWVANNELMSKTCGSEVDITGFYNVVFNSYTRKIIHKTEIADILQINEDVATQISDWWDKKKEASSNLY